MPLNPDLYGRGVRTDLSDVVTSEMSLKPHLECFTNPNHINIKCFCTLTSCEWVYGTTLSLIPPLRRGSIFRNTEVGTDLSDVVTSEMSLKAHLECFTNPCYIYIKCFWTLISCEWVYGTILSLIPPPKPRVNFQEFGGRDQPIWLATSEMSLKPHLECLTNPCYMYIKWVSAYW